MASLQVDSADESVPQQMAGGEAVKTDGGACSVRGQERPGVLGNRESLEIIDLILLVCLNGTMKTHIMYKCNLNSKQVQEYLEIT